MSDATTILPTTGVLLAQTSIGWPQQQEFVRFSGDRNPMHTDALAARRTPPGSVVTHGMHILLWALDALASAERLEAVSTRLQVRFLKWIYLDDKLCLWRRAGTGDGLRFEVRVGEMVAISCSLKRDEPASVSAAGMRPVAGAVLSQSQGPRTLLLDELEGREGLIPAQGFSASATMFPSLARLFGPGFAAEIAACSYVVGMEAPGLYSIDSIAEWRIAPSPADRAGVLGWRVVSVDPRFRRARIEVAGSMISGRLEAFVRHPPVRQPVMRHVSEQVVRNEFAEMRALVVGGSRGLGEVAAKCVAAGGGACTVTYAVGESDAAAVVTEIREAGGSAHAVLYDARLAAAPQLQAVHGPFTHVLYFASGPIFRPQGSLLSAERLAEFNSIYVQGFHDLCLALLQPEAGMVEAGTTLTAFYPSTSLLDDRGAGFTEYAASKAAGEQLCQDMDRFLPRCRVMVARLPRLLTDQTAPMAPERFPDAVTALLPLLRQLKPGQT